VDKPITLFSSIHSKLPRADASAKEAVATICNQAGNLFDVDETFRLAIAGAADKHGRLHTDVGGWQIHFRTSALDRYICARLFANGNISVTLQSTWESSAPIVFPLEGDWIDSTVAADAMQREPLPDGMSDRYALFLDLRPIEDTRLFWEVRRIDINRTTQLDIRHSIWINAMTRDVAAEAIEQTKLGKVLESRWRDRLNSRPWVDK
jgi:hypothetical protein